MPIKWHLYYLLIRQLLMKKGRVCPLFFLGKMKNNWNQLVEQFPNDPILLDAIAIVRPLLIEDAAFQSQIKNLKVLNISNNEIEEEVYARAAELGFSENCEAAVPKLKQYIQQFQPALHGTEANYPRFSYFF